MPELRHTFGLDAQVNATGVHTQAVEAQSLAAIEAPPPSPFEAKRNVWQGRYQRRCVPTSVLRPKVTTAAHLPNDIR
jgi:hypothetical protein